MSDQIDMGRSFNGSFNTQLHEILVADESHRRHARFTKGGTRIHHRHGSGHVKILSVGARLKAFPL
jgi:hypothetical protein